MNVPALSRVCWTIAEWYAVIVPPVLILLEALTNRDFILLRLSGSQVFMTLSVQRSRITSPTSQKINRLHVDIKWWEYCLIPSAEYLPHSPFALYVCPNTFVLVHFQD